MAIAFNNMQSFIPGLLAALLYGGVSGSMSFMNKILLTSYKYHFPEVIMLVQIVVTSIVVEISRILHICDIPAWTFHRSKEFFIPSLCFALHTTLALAALDDLSIPIYNALRRMLPLASLIMSVLILKQKPSRNMVLSIGLMMCGTLFAGIGDLRFTIKGYGEAIASVVAQSFYLTYVQKTGIEKGVSALSVLHLNSINCIPLMLLYTIGNGHLQKSLDFPGFADYDFVVSFVLNIFLGCILNYTLFLCATMNSALTTSIVGVIKGVLTTSIGFFTFGGASVNHLTIGGVVLNSIGGILYIMVKYREKMGSIKRTLLPSSQNYVKTSDGDVHASLFRVSSRHRNKSVSSNDDSEIRSEEEICDDDEKLTSTD